MGKIIFLNFRATIVLGFLCVAEAFAGGITPGKCVPILAWMDQGGAALSESPAQKLCMDGAGNACNTVKNESQAICQILGGNQCGRSKNLAQAMCWSFQGNMCDAKKADEDASAKAQLKLMCLKSTLTNP